VRLRWALVALGALAGSCGYSTGLTVPPGIHSVGVEIFGNDGRLRDMELDMHYALSDSVRRLVDAPLVDPAQADLVLRGRIVEYRKRGGIRSTDNELLEDGVRISVEVQLVRRFAESVVAPGPEPDRTGAEPSSRDDRSTLPATAPNERVLRPMRATQEFGFRIAEPNGEALARERTLLNLADRIVLDLFGTLAYESTP
jgi:hypothetical protein